MIEPGEIVRCSGRASRTRGHWSTSPGRRPLQPTSKSPDIGSSLQVCCRQAVATGTPGAKSWMVSAMHSLDAWVARARIEHANRHAA